jgi:hypothetical protein
MKTITFCSILFLINCFCIIPAFGQYNPFTNSFRTNAADNPASADQVDNLIDYSSVSGVECTDNSFWAYRPSGADLFSISGEVITQVGTTVITGGFDANLAYCNNLNGGDFSPTFYSTKNLDQPVYFDGSGVTSSGDTSPDKLINCGGNGNFLYYISYDSAYEAKAIVKYNGSTFTAVYYLPDSIVMSVADLAVDDYGNVWFFTGPKGETYQSDTLKVVSPGGQLLKRYPFQYDTDNGYGCFMLKGKIYIGLGSYNTAHPNTVLPITITSESATAGTPLLMPVSTSYSDMASCAAGAPLSVYEQIPVQDIKVYPNPVVDKLTICCNSGESYEVILYDFTSRELLHQNFTGSVTLNTGPFSKGIYIYKIRNNSGAEKSGKVIK